MMRGPRARAWLVGFVRAAPLSVTVVAAAAAIAAGYPTAYTVDTAAVMVSGVSARALTDAAGKTLYYVATDTPTRSTCTGMCASVWLPLLSDSAPATGAPLPGKLALVKTANGSQVSYNGHPLYTYSGDSGPHQANGQGVAGQWWVATVDLKPAMTAMPGAPGTAPSKNDQGHGGY
jgi:predicted lipoprotein with Yx(FWY)xxD motif